MWSTEDCCDKQHAHIKIKVIWALSSWRGEWVSLSPENSSWEWWLCTSTSGTRAVSWGRPAAPHSPGAHVALKVNWPWGWCSQTTVSISNVQTPHSIPMGRWYELTWESPSRLEGWLPRNPDFSPMRNSGRKLLVPKVFVSKGRVSPGRFQPDFKWKCLLSAGFTISLQLKPTK